MRIALALFVVCFAQGCSGCDRTAAPTRPAPVDGGAEKGEERALDLVPDAELVARARRSADCGPYEPMPCDDDAIGNVRCELAGRARRSKTLFQMLVADANGSDAKLRAAALRVLADSDDPAAVEAIHRALVDPSLDVACRAAAYGIYFRKTDRARMIELGEKCDGAPVIKATADAIGLATGDVVKAGVSCDELRGEP